MRKASTALRKLIPTEVEQLRQDLRAFLHAAGRDRRANYLEAMTPRPVLVPLLGMIQSFKHTGGPRRLFGRRRAPTRRAAISGRDFPRRGGRGSSRPVFRALSADGSFSRFTKKRFCSQRCQSRIYMRQLRADARAEHRSTRTKGNTAWQKDADAVKARSCSGPTGGGWPGGSRLAGRQTPPESLLRRDAGRRRREAHEKPARRAARRHVARRRAPDDPAIPRPLDR